MVVQVKDTMHLYPEQVSINITILMITVVDYSYKNDLLMWIKILRDT